MMEVNRERDCPKQALRSVLQKLESCLHELDRLGEGMIAVRLAHAVEGLQTELSVVTMPHVGTLDELNSKMAG